MELLGLGKAGLSPRSASQVIHFLALQHVRFQMALHADRSALERGRQKH
jgi:hypothetical protein